MISYGHHLGMAFQIADDVLDYKGDPRTIGKNIGDDLSEGKMTLPLIFARDNSSSSQAELIRRAISNKSGDNFSDILDVIRTTGGLEYSLKQAEEEANLAKTALVNLPASQYKKVMLELADFSVSRLI